MAPPQEHRNNPEPVQINIPFPHREPIPFTCFPLEIQCGEWRIEDVYIFADGRHLDIDGKKFIGVYIDNDKYHLLSYIEPILGETIISFLEEDDVYDGILESFSTQPDEAAIHLNLSMGGLHMRIIKLGWHIGRLYINLDEDGFSPMNMDNSTVFGVILRDNVEPYFITMEPISSLIES